MRARASGVRGRVFVAALVAVGAFALLLAGGFGGSVARADSGRTARHVGTIDLATLSSRVAFTPVVPNRPRLIDQDIDKDVKGAATPTKSKNKPPKPAGSPVTSTNPGFAGFNGLDDFDQLSAGTDDYAG